MPAPPDLRVESRSVGERGRPGIDEGLMKDVPRLEQTPERAAGTGEEAASNWGQGGGSVGLGTGSDGWWG
jgi:hypothetical protein